MIEIVNFLFWIQLATCTETIHASAITLPGAKMGKTEVRVLVALPSRYPLGETEETPEKLSELTVVGSNMCASSLSNVSD